MRRRAARGLFHALTSPDHIAAAVVRTVRGKRRRPDVAAFLLDLEGHERTVLARLADGTWSPQRPTLLLLRDPKPRVIAKSTVADRVVHSAVALLLEPVILRSASEADFACRPAYGTHRAVLALQRAMRDHRFVLHLDIRSYFPSVRPEIVAQQVRGKIDDPAFVAVVERILESGRGLYDTPAARRFAHIDPDWPPPGRGLPMGSVTSQLFATHLHLQDFDHEVKRRWKVAGYLRYVDDLFLFADSRARLRGLRQDVAAWLAAERDLRLKHPNAPVLPCAGHLDALGARIRRQAIEPLPEAFARLRACLWEWARGRHRNAPREGMQRALASRLGGMFRL